MHKRSFVFQIIMDHQVRTRLRRWDEHWEAPSFAKRRKMTHDSAKISGLDIKKVDTNLILDMVAESSYIPCPPRRGPPRWGYIGPPGGGPHECNKCDFYACRDLRENRFQPWYHGGRWHLSGVNDRREFRHGSNKHLRTSFFLCPSPNAWQELVEAIFESAERRGILLDD